MTHIFFSLFLSLKIIDSADWIMTSQVGGDWSRGVACGSRDGHGAHSRVINADMAIGDCALSVTPASVQCFTDRRCGLSLSNKKCTKFIGII